MGFLSRIFGTSPATTAPGYTPPEVVVADFGNLMATRAPAPGMVADATELPHPKEEIKRAILVLLSQVKDRDMQESLKVAYFCLADWQIGVGPRHLGADFTKIDLRRPAAELLAQTAARRKEVQRWAAIVTAERVALVQDLRQRRLW